MARRLAGDNGISVTWLLSVETKKKKYRCNERREEEKEEEEEEGRIARVEEN